ncbi:aspartate/glutamate racemase family protein [Thalassotalea sp. G20_0]|uniref:aspartate/glutamate racemase family protein n=1 Tax=Thalassotalea sp. G20_0 TaxID=2821093 RepID=UPI001ADAA69D|nr:aspartate/glutamate racemase family protein [Thalassotalea sp. G20_0]MBO9494892.1 aspartate/glutamate racemase family protein [Thalassotalea sp. G20_0]
MKTIGLIGGMSWESTLSYYKGINEGVKTSLGGLHSARVALYSVDFAEIEKLQHQGEWDKTAEILSAAARSVEAGGADFFLICTNTMHKVAEAVEKSVAIPLVHIADATGELLVKDGIKRVGLLGTRFTMEQAFYKNRLLDKFGIEVVIPDEAEREVVHQVIHTELCLGQINNASRNQYLKIISSLHNQGAEAVILGCTEIALLVQQTQTTIPLYDTTEIHAQKAVKLAISE